ncbi:MAG TPA: quinone-dependent dihydroorotate dehydrogenase [Elusimicrobiota bacterium]|nr:quinone-dependent dihydroorotate dehydrogenase [Elusimicrobiota bacterium]
MGLEPQPLPGRDLLPPGARRPGPRPAGRGGALSLYRALRPLLFALAPETAHHAANAALAAACRLGLGGALRGLFAADETALASTVAGLRFPNPVGLAAGFDKDAALAGALQALGFGFIETGTVTLRPQPGNPRPRLFRVPEARALLNRMGFNNAGAAAAAARLAGLKERRVPIGVNLGLNKDASPESAPAEYAAAFSLLEPHGDYFAVNVSSPNTPGLRGLQAAGRLEAILDAIAAENRRRKPVFVKLAPDLEDAALLELAPLLSAKSSGAICSNTTLSRSGLPEWCSREAGGISGAPLRQRSTRMLSLLYKATSGKLPLIGVGGIFTADEAYAKIRAGASLVQVYTGLIYEGPGLPGELCRGLARRLEKDGLASLSEAVGVDAN